MAWILLLADTHFTASPADEYRWCLFDQITNYVNKYKPAAVVILGDLTHFKDEHPAALVTRLVEQLVNLASIVPVRILQGNHDYTDIDNAFFRILNAMVGDIEFVTSRDVQVLGGHRCLFLPFETHILKHWSPEDPRFKELEARDGVHPYKCDFTFLHQPFDMAQTGNGQYKSGFAATVLDRFEGMPYSGDIHMPQKLGRLTYIGSPYPTCFGEEHTPRMLLVDKVDGKYVEKVLPVATIRKATIYITSAEDIKQLYAKQELGVGDQIKIRYKCPPDKIDDYHNVQREALKAAAWLKIDVRGFEVIREDQDLPEAQKILAQTPEEIVRKFALAQKVHPKTTAEGVRLVKA